MASFCKSRLEEVNRRGAERAEKARRAGVGLFCARRGAGGAGWEWVRSAVLSWDVSGRASEPMAGALDETGARDRARRSLCVMGMVNFPLSHAA